ncbi:fibrinogen-related domain-containing protein [Paraburkholderia aspalathi]|nr:fibrinogen-related domain-containing protein [Paraburkholderia aspalathi]MBK3780208.1 fibrinogen-related domain-containing protein [Paraburkholderia aspalathi]
MNKNPMKNQGGFAVVPLLFLVILAVAVTTVMATSVVRPLMQSVASSRARALTDAAMSVAVTQLSGTTTFTDSNGAVLPPYVSASFAPAGGGQLPAALPNSARFDGWGNAFGYCVASSAAVSDGAVAIVSAGKDGVFQTPCTTALLGQPVGDDGVRVITSASLLKGRTGAIDHGRPVASLSALNALQYIAPGEIRPVLDNGGGTAGVYLNPTGAPGAWQPVQSQGNQISPYMNGLVAYWPMDEVSGTTAFDAKNSHDIAFASSTVTPGMFGSARLITNSADWTMGEIPGSNTLQVSVAMWLDTSTLQNAPMPMPFTFETYDIWYVKSLNYIGFNTYNSEVRGVQPPPGKHFYVFVMDTRKDAGDNFAPDERIYIDGVRQPVLTLQGSQPIPANRKFAGTAHMGQNATSAPNTWALSNEFADDMAVWDRALTDQEVYQLFNTGRSLGELMTEQAGFVQRSGAWQPMAAAPYPMCQDYHNNGAMADGIYLINPPGASAPFQVRCDMTRDGGGWTVFQRRYNGGINFYQGWSAYQNGFGSLTGEFWLGLDKLNLLTATPRSIRVDLGRYTGAVAYAKYSSFSVGPASNNYLLSISGFQGGTAGDSLTAQNGMQYSTYDADHDLSTGNCAVTFQGAWWYNNCHASNLNGAWLNGPHSSYANGVEWDTWTGYYESLTYTEMKVR